MAAAVAIIIDQLSTNIYVYKKINLIHHPTIERETVVSMEIIDQLSTNIYVYVYNY